MRFCIQWLDCIRFPCILLSAFCVLRSAFCVLRSGFCKLRQVLLATFLLNLAAGLYLFLPLVGRRSAGVKFYRLILITTSALVLGAAAAHWLGNRRDLATHDLLLVALSALLYVVFRFPRRFVYRAAGAVLGIGYVVVSVTAYHAAVRPLHPGWSVAGALSSIALLGSVNLAMLLGHWYLVVRGMPIDPLRRLTLATIAAASVKVILVVLALLIGGVAREIAVQEGIFFWMRVGWGLAGPILLFPMIWGTVKLRSTMAATGILYVDVVAVVIGEILGAWLSTIARVPV